MNHSDKSPFAQLCAIVTDCAKAYPDACLTDLMDIVGTVLAKRKIAPAPGELHRAISAVLDGPRPRAASIFARTIEAKRVGKFRSILESRWAAVFAAAKVAAQFEPSWFNLAVPYLPDFYLPALKVWLEIKPAPPDDAAILKAKLLTIHTRQRVYVLAGPPAVNENGPAFTSQRITESGEPVFDSSWITPPIRDALETYRPAVNWEMIGHVLHANGLVPQPDPAAIKRRREAASAAIRAEASVPALPSRSDRAVFGLPVYAREHVASSTRGLPSYLLEHVDVDRDEDE